MFDDSTDEKIEEHSTMASPTNVVLGTFMLWWGWLGFNCGSTFGVSGGMSRHIHRVQIAIDESSSNNDRWGDRFIARTLVILS